MTLIPVYKEIELVKFDGDTIQWCCPEWVHEALASGLLWVENDRLYRKNWCDENCMLTSVEKGGYVARTDGFIFLMDAETENRLTEFYRVKPQE